MAGATNNDAVLKFFASLTIVSLGILGAAFWRWADVVNVRANDIFLKLQDIAKVQATILVKQSNLEDLIENHIDDYAHEGARNALNGLDSRMHRIADDLKRMQEKIIEARERDLAK